MISVHNATCMLSALEHNLILFHFMLVQIMRVIQGAVHRRPVVTRMRLLLRHTRPRQLVRLPIVDPATKSAIRCLRHLFMAAAVATVNQVVTVSRPALSTRTPPEVMSFIRPLVV